MIRFTHRRCRTERDRLLTQHERLEAEVRTADRRTTDAQAETARLRTEAGSAAAEVERLKDRLAAADNREKDLVDRVWELECQINDLTETDSPFAVARTRQTRAVHRALVQGEEARAQALSTLPWQAFDPELELLES
ncbi:hypothetical protein ACWFMI_27305 [Nocardiopsis terrae]